MADNNEIKTCPKDCMKCPPNQWLYCAAQMSRTSVERLDELQVRFEKMEDKVKKLNHAGEGVFNPMADEQPV